MRSLSAFSGVAIHFASIPSRDVVSTSVSGRALFGWIACIFSRTTSTGSFASTLPLNAPISASYRSLAIAAVSSA